MEFYEEPKIIKKKIYSQRRNKYIDNWRIASTAQEDCRARMSAIAKACVVMPIFCRDEKSRFKWFASLEGGIYRHILASTVLNYCKMGGLGFSQDMPVFC